MCPRLNRRYMAQVIDFNKNFGGVYLDFLDPRKRI
jgi:hypothetical protein